WIETEIDPGAALEVEALGSIPRVFERRPVPSYIRTTTGLLAYGSLPGELVEYTGIEDDDWCRLAARQASWTTDLDPGAVAELLDREFLQDLERCCALTGDPRFLEYREQHVRLGAETSTPALLASIH